MQPRTKGIRLLAAAAWMLVGVGAIHALGHFLGRPQDAHAVSVFGAMDGYRMAFPLGMAPSLLDVFRSLSLGMAVLTAGLGALLLAALRHGAEARPLLRALAGVCACVVAAMIALELVHRILPPLVLFSICEAALIAAWFRLRDAER